MTIHKAIVVFFICSVGIFIGCAPSLSNSDNSSDERAYIDALKEKADAFAQSELARYNAIELIYKNIPEMHTTRVPINNNLIKGWTKTYRRFTEYEVVDIIRSESMLSPIQYKITFHFEQYNTPYRKSDEPNAQQRCEDDFEYELHFTESLTRNFACDTQGTLLEPTTAPPERPLYFKRDYLRETTTMPSLP